MTTSSASQILFIDAAVSDVDTLLASLDPSFEVVRLNADEDGLTQIARALAGRTEVGALHVVSHGESGALQLGNGIVDLSTLSSSSIQLSLIREALSADADLLLYGCNVAEGDAGALFIEALAQATQADVAASVDLTGAAWLGGDWVLEAETGSIEAAPIVAESMDAVLASGILRNAYVRFGYSDDGTLGVGGNAKPGIQYDPNGTRNFLDTADSLTPGSPYEGFTVKIGSTSYTENNDDGAGASQGTYILSTNLTTSGADTWGSVTFRTEKGGLRIDQTYTLSGVDAKVISMTVRMENISGSTVSNVSYARFTDPDVDSNGLPGATSSTNNVRGADGIAASDIVLATGPVSGRVIGLYSDSSFTHNTSVDNWWSSNPSEYLSGVSDGNGDYTIGIGFNLGNFAVGESKTFSFAYVFAANAAALAASVAEVPRSNAAPTLTGFAAPVDAVNEDSQIEITYAELAAQGNEADDSAIAAFVVKAISSGTLKIGSSAGTATNWTPGSNDAVPSDGSLKLYWTPAANANGALNAFTVVARDDEGAVSSSNIQVQVTVNAVNDAPTLASNVVLTTLAEDAAGNDGKTVASLFGGVFADVDAGQTLGGVIVTGNDADAATQGQWEYYAGGSWHAMGAVSDSAGLALSASTAIRFLPVLNYNGTPGGLTVHAADSVYAGGYTAGATPVTFDTTSDAATSGVSSGSRNVSVTVSAVNDAPVFTSSVGDAAMTETHAYDATLGDLALTSGALTGTLTASDVESNAISFRIRGGVESSGSDTFQGQFGLLTVNHTTGAWTYTPNHWVEINALQDETTATDTFTFLAEDAGGASSPQQLVITFTGTNDDPVVTHTLQDQVVTPAAAWTYQIPAAAFTDAEGGALSYTVEVINGSGTVIDTIGATVDTSPGNASQPSYWLSFDAASRTLSGTPLNGASLPLEFRVTATDGFGDTAVSEFTATLGSLPASASATVENASPLATNDRVWMEVDATERVLTLGDFGNYSDAEGSPLDHIALTTLTGGGKLQLFDGTSWNDLNLSSAQIISATEVSAGHLRFVPGGSPTVGDGYAHIGFKVNDDSADSATGYTLSVDMAADSAGATTSLAASSQSGVPANTWTNVYGAGDTNPVGGFGAGTVRLVISTDAGHIRLSNVPAGVTMVTTGYGNATDGTATSLALEGSQTDVNAALANLQVNRGTASEVNVSLDAVVGGAAYDPTTGHYYMAVDNISDISWADAKTAAEGMTLNGLTGYLATVTTAEENAFILSKLPADGWIGASDAETEGTWKWVTGPEAGTVFSTGNISPTTLTYANWNSAEPNDSNGDEDYAEFFANGGVRGRWNDLPGTDTNGISYYIVEFGGTGTPAAAPAARTVSLSGIDPQISVAGSAAYTENAAATVLNPSIDIHYPGGSISAATVRISSNLTSGDVLAFANDGSTMGDIAASYNAGTGTLTLSSVGGATEAQWEAALAAVTFASSSNNPGDAARGITWSVTGNGVTASDTSTVAVTAINDAPTLNVPLPDVDVGAGGAVSVTLPGSIFVDPEGAAITLTATLPDGTSALPSWLSFDPVTGHFSGNAPAGIPSLDVLVTGTDASGAHSSTSFTFNFGTTVAAAQTANSVGTVAVTGDTAGSIVEGQTLTATVPVDVDGLSGGVQYQWRVSADGGTTWSDITGDRGRAPTLTLAQSEAGKQVLVQAFYNDNGGFAEAPVSSPVSVTNLNAAGSILVSGGLAPAQTLGVTLADGDGMLDASPSYQWYASADGSHWTAITGATYNTYTLTEAEGGQYVRVVTSYSDDMGGVESLTWTSPSAVQLGAVAPLAGDDSASLTEASGAANVIPGTSPATGSLFANDTDANSGDTKTLTGLRTGSMEGFGTAGTSDGTLYTVEGDYGVLTVNLSTGAYSYALNETHGAVQALAVGSTLMDRFNYTVSDAGALSDTAVLSITINGANDLPTVSGIEAAATVVEDSPVALPLDVLSFVEPDSASFALRLTVTTGTLRAVSADSSITITGSDSGTLTISAGSPRALTGWLVDNDVLFVTAPNQNGAVATLSYALNDGSGFLPSGTSTVITATATNDAPIVDVGGASTAGNDGSATFRPRGDAVAIAPSLTLSDIDGSTLTSATVTLATGASDNQFGTLYETLSLSSTGQSLVSAAGLTLTSVPSSSGAVLTITGPATLAQYQAVLREVLYNNTNPNAFAGDRTVTVSVTDDSSAVSNTASFATASANASITIGQRIFIDGADSGQLVAQVLDAQHFVASGPLTGLASGSALSFYDAAHQPGGAAATTAVQAGPLVATTTVHVPWTPVIDVNGAGAGVDRTITYTEGQSAVAIATSDASITDQGGMIRSLTVALTNPQDNGVSVHEFLNGPNASVTSWLSARSITYAGNGTGANGMTGATQIVFTASGGGSDATNFQVALRGVTYQNTSQNPSATQRDLLVSSIDVDGNSGVNAHTHINLVGVNDAPHGINSAVTLVEDGSHTFAASDFGFSDPTDAADGSPNTLSAIHISSLPASGTLLLDEVPVTAGQIISLAALNAGHLVYRPAADQSGTAIASFGFHVQDNGGIANGGVDLDPATATMTLNVTPVNDAPELSANGADLSTITEDEVSNAGQAVSALLGLVSDADVGAHTATNGTLTGMAVHEVSSGGITGTWQYQVGAGSWTDFDFSGAHAGSAVLLSSTDRVRFVPDTEGGTTAHHEVQPSLSYYAWDQSAGVAGGWVSVASRGGSTALSVASDTVALTVTDVNDAPTVDLNGATGGTSNTITFSPQGNAVPLFDSDLTLGDVDVGDLLTGATLVMDADDTLDNAFGTTYETLGTTLPGHVYAGSLGGITLSGNGTESDPLVLTGVGTAADYKAALQTLVYNNTNPNAFAGVRHVAVTVHDAATTTLGAGASSSTAATLSIAVNWGAVADLNGEDEGRDHVISYTENTPSVAIAASNASLTDQDGNIASVTVTLTNHPDGSSEKLYVDPAQITSFAGIGITISGNNSHAITLTGNQDGTYFQLALRAIRYVNSSENPTTTPREVHVASVDVDGNVGVGATTTINLVAVNDAPTSADATQTLDEDTGHTFQVSDFPFSDVDANSLLAVRVSSLPAFGTLMLDGVTVTAGALPLDVSREDIAAGLFTYVPNANANNDLNGRADSFDFRVIDNGGIANGGVAVSVAVHTFSLSVTPVNDLPVPNPPVVTVSGVSAVGSMLTAHLEATDVDFAGGVIPGSEYVVTWQTRSLPSGAWTDVTTGTTYVLAGSDANKEIRAVLSYHDTGASTITVESDSPTEPLVVVAADGSLTIDVDGGSDPDAPITIALPAGTTGPVVINNTGTTPISVTGLVAPATLSTSGSGPLDIDHPTGNVGITNTGTGTVTVAGPDDGSILSVHGTGPVTVINPDGDLTVHNIGTGTTTVTGLDGGSVLTTTGTGLTTVAAPENGATVNNTGSGLVTVTGVVDTLNVMGAGPITVASPANGATVNNTGTGPVTVTGVTGTLNVAGTGDTYVDAPADGSHIHDQGSGDLTINHPSGDLSVSSDGVGHVIVNGAADGSTLTTHGPVEIAHPDGSLTLAGDGHNTVTGLGGGTSVLTTTGTGPTDVVAPASGATVANEGTGALTVTGVTGLLNTQGSGPVTVSAPADHATVNNTGTGLTTVSGVIGLVNTDGTGPVVIDAPAAGASVHDAGSGPVTVNAPAGDLTVDSDGEGAFTVHSPAAGSIITSVGEGAVSVDGASGAFTLRNDGTGLVSLEDPAAGSAVTLAGTGPIAIVSHLEAGEHLTLDTHGNSNVQISNLGEGTIDLVGGLSLDGGDPVVVSLTGDDTTPLSVTGAVSLDGTPLELRLGYTPALGDEITLLANDGDDAVSGTFAGLPEGSSFYVDGRYFRISYVGGSGNDVVLTRVNSPLTGTVAIQGDPVFGQTLTAAVSLTDLDGRGAYGYQWLANGEAISGATQSSYKLKATDIGKNIQLVVSEVDALGSRESVTSQATTRVADGNGVASQVESTAPALTPGGVAGDGNGDGIQDDRQAEVVSAPLQGADSSENHFVTLVVDSLDGKPQVDSTASLQNFQQIEAPVGAPSQAVLPVGQISFEATVETAGITENFSLYVDASMNVNGYWKQNAEGVLTNLASEAYGGRIVVEGDKVRLDFTIADGGEFDADHLANGVIVDPGAVGFMPLSLIGYAPDAPAEQLKPGESFWG